MATVITVKKHALKDTRTSGALHRLREVLPAHLLCEIERCMGKLFAGEVLEEIRLRSDRRVYLTLGGAGRRNLALTTVLNSAELSQILDKMCDGSLYAYSESIIKGYVSPGGGIRVGVCGRASVERGRILGVYDISALNIRLPCGRVALDEVFLDQVRATLKKGEGVLVYSPPAQGKTTLLRSLAVSLAGGNAPMRVAVVDTRGELGSYEADDALSLDVLSGYPQAEGIRIATAFMSPQVIICDEIGDKSEAEAIAEAQNCGVPLVASAHGADVGGVLRRNGMKRLHDVGAFGLYAGIMIGEGGCFRYDLQSREEIVCEDSRHDIALS